jgi:hypothetical protein
VGEEVGTKGVDMRGSREANDAAGGKLATMNIEVHAQGGGLGNNESHFALGLVR